MIGYLSKFFYILAGKRRQLFFLIFFFLLTSLMEAIGIGLVGPFIALASNPQAIYQNSWLHWFYTRSGFQNDKQFLYLLSAATIGILYFKSVLSFYGQKYVFKFSFKQQGELSAKLLHSYLAAPYTFHLNRNSALLIQNVVNETDKFCTHFMLPFLTSLANITVILALIFLLSKTNLIATLSVAAILLPAFGLIYFFRYKISQWGQEASESNTEMIRIINHGLGGLKETRIIGCESYFENQMKAQIDKFAFALSSFQAFSILPRILLEAILVTFLVGFTIIFLLSNQNAENLTSVLGVFAMASIRLLPSVSNTIYAFGIMRNSTYSVDKVYYDLKEIENLEVERGQKILDERSLRKLFDSKSYSKCCLPFEQEIILDKITYRYPSATETNLKEISLHIKKGQSIGIIGKSGAGKTTLIDVILGLLAPETGNIRVDGKTIYNDLRSWQNLIGYIPQSIFLIDDTIEKNITFGVPDDLIDKPRLEKAIQSAQLEELIEQLPDGINTVVGERGVRLSGGQRQRIGIARVLYHEREILVLDEATAALDNETESLVSEAIRSLSGTKTMIIIAHRLSTLEHCDRVYSIEKGRVVKSGSYQEVVACV
ncbi:ABC transporter ATP-binding protein [Chroococcidiopsis sp. FACHB-1243]|uniref:ATP-binding cassette domain-containing protein n=1 Tax=Chroococcidiopsis sp. [FACHB-1243] TaxID=2692781 RepID=UPI00177F6BDC|nr:ABC transporter ATP-binding protein [Chroococcidiopsis sp. [FACHB-1243]]